MISILSLKKQDNLNLRLQAFKVDWQYQTQFSDLHGEFPELVDEQGAGWFCRHVHGICDFVKGNPDVTSKPAQEHCKKLSRGFNDAWRNKVLQFQTPIFSPTTRGAWVLRFDDILADAKEQGQLHDRDILLSSAVKQIITTTEVVVCTAPRRGKYRLNP